MPFDLLRWKPLKYTGLVLAATGLFASVGCQKWSLRHNILGYDKDAADDWAPPVDESHSALEREPMVGQESRGRAWWGKNVAPQIPRVELPRNRAKREEAKLEGTKASPTLSQPEPPVPSPNKANDAPNAPSPLAIPPATSFATPGKPKEGALITMGANPKSGPGPVVKSISGDDAASTQPSHGTSPGTSSPKVVDTGTTDVDIQGAIQSLPPEYRDIVARTFQAMKEEQRPAAGAMAASPPINPAQPAAPTNIADAAATTSVVADQANSSGRVSVRLSGDENTPAPTHAAQQPDAPTTEVAKAIVTPELLGNGPVVPTRAEVVQTSHTAPPLPSPPLPTSPIPTSPIPTSNMPSAVAAVSDRTVSPTDAQSANKAVATSKSDGTHKNWFQANNDAIERLETALESAHGTDEALRRSQEITLRLLYVAQRRLEDALRPIDGLDEHEQEYIRHQMQALYEASNPDANPARGRHWGTVMVSQREATSHLAAASNLEVRSVSFCTQVDGYGMVQKFARYQFAPDQDVLLYCEVDNVAAQQLKNGYETQLQGSYEIRDAQGRRVAEQILPMEPEICQNHRRDYFMVYRIYMPQQIPPGSYQLKLTIEDMKGKKFGHSTADFEIRK